MKKRKLIKRFSLIVLFGLAFVIMIAQNTVQAAEGPLFYLVPSGNNVFIILGDTPRQVYGFRVFRKGPGEREYKIITKDMIKPVKDPYRAREILDGDYAWVARKIGTDDPVLLWQRLNGNRNISMLLCLVSHRLRLALGRTYVDKNLKSGKQYSYKLIFYNTLEKEILKKVKSVKIAKLPEQPAVKKVVAKGEDGRVSLTWSYPKYTGSDRDVTVGFHIYKKAESGGFKRVTSAPVFRIENSLFYLDENVENGKEYIYGVAPVNIIGEVGNITRYNKVKPVDKTPPLVPMGLTAKDTEEGVLLLWKFSPEIDFDHYNVFRSTTLKGEYKRINNVSLKTPRYLDKDIVRGNIYYYKVTAVDKSGNESKPSGAVNIVPKDLTPPKAVAGISAAVDEDRRFVTLTWKPPGDKDVLGYYIYRGENKKSLIRITEKPYLPDNKELSYVDSGYRKKGLYAGKHLIYGISACDRSFNEGPIAYVEVDIPDNVPPHPVFSFTANVTREGWVRLVWQPSLSKDLAYHRIYRASGKKSNFEILVELKKDVTEYFDKQAERGKKVSYYVTEIDKNGNESKKSRVVEVVPTDVIPPEKPGSFKVVPEGRRLILQWSKPKDSDILGYNVWYCRSLNGSCRWKKLNKGIITGLTIKVKNYGSGRYAVSAIDTSMNEGQRSVFKYREEKSETAK